MNCRKQPVSTHCPEGIPMGDLTALICDADRNPACSSFSKALGMLSDLYCQM